MQEEETALLKIGQVLEWEGGIAVAQTTPTDWVLESAPLDTDQGHQRYIVEFNSDDSPQTKVVVLGGALR